MIVIIKSRSCGNRLETPINPSWGRLARNADKLRTQGDDATLTMKTFDSIDFQAEPGANGYVASLSSRWQRNSNRTVAMNPGAVQTRGTTQVAPIPEPETYALMLAGLAVVGAAARRRKAKQTVSS